MNLRDMLDVSPEVRDAVRFGHAVVALSTTALAHSIPAPHRAAFASDTEAAVRGGRGRSRVDGRARRRAARRALPGAARTHLPGTDGKDHAARPARRCRSAPDGRDLRFGGARARPVWQASAFSRPAASAACAERT